MNHQANDESNPSVLVIRKKKYSLDETKGPEHLEAEAYNQKKVQGARTAWTKKTILKGAQIKTVNKRAQQALALLD